ncbi:DUF3261 domain-containing protein [uncultured Pseudoteredinibacter sp.]|uniref:DUF3261 domain-containing protein n=1 Tax=uncultured Pseudoteredinibacter sp. TaxID=1641701 RepID=UPI002606D3DE|nr:DUF3261 domain-containing protein [uncultured Pseudoteredinibacter sp.]
MFWWKLVGKLFSLVTTLSLIACTHTSLLQTAQLPLLPADSWNAKFQLNQSITISGKDGALLLALVKKEDSLEVTILNNLGQRLVQLSHTGLGVRLTKHWPDITLPADAITRQLQASLWPIDILTQFYSEGWSVKESKCQRDISYRQDLILTVNYCAYAEGSTSQRLLGARIEDHKSGLSIDIETHELTPL